MTEEAFARRVTRVGSLADPVRRALYRFVAAQSDAVSRDQAADGVDVPRHTAKFHLERLVDEGLLVAEFRRLTGRTGPGAGRPAKLYRRARKELSVSVPSRRYDLAGRVLADAVERALDGVPMNEAVTDAAQQAAVDVVDNAKPAGKDLARVAGVLADYGYEPQLDGDLVLANCPYDRLAAEHRELVCGMNLDFVRAVADRLGCDGDRVELAPDPPQCCVRVRAVT